MRWNLFVRTRVFFNTQIFVEMTTKCYICKKADIETNEQNRLQCLMKNEPGDHASQYACSTCIALPYIVNEWLCHRCFLYKVLHIENAFGHQPQIQMVDRAVTRNFLTKTMRATDGILHVQQLINEAKKAQDAWMKELDKQSI